MVKYSFVALDYKEVTSVRSCWYDRIKHYNMIGSVVFVFIAPLFSVRVFPFKIAENGKQLRVTEAHSLLRQPYQPNCLTVDGSYVGSY